MTFKLDKNFEEKVYAGVLGKIIGVFLGRPFEGWSYERIMKELGPINYYVNEKLVNLFLSKKINFLDAIKSFMVILYFYFK